MSSWGQKLEKRLSSLADSASKESMQTLAKWIGFNRKHCPAFCESIFRILTDTVTNETRQWLIWQVIHEVLVLDKSDSSKWEKLQDLRRSLGEIVIVPTLEKNDSVIMADKIKPLADQWDDIAAFDGPLLIQHIQRLLKSPKKLSGDVAAVVAAPAEEHNLDPETTASSNSEKNDVQSKQVEISAEPPASESSIDQFINEKPIEKLPVQLHQEKATKNTTATEDDVEFDFEKEGIPAGKVDAKEFLEPCRALATLQIARDLRSDAVVQLSSILAAIPTQVKKSCQDLDESAELSEDVANRLSVELGDAILDIDFDEAQQNVETFRDLVQKQRKAREALVYLLLRSRCQFGANEAALAFYGLDDMMEKLQRRRELLEDAMDLEGVDSEDVEKGVEKVPDRPLEAFTWYEKEPRETKRAKLG